MSTHVLQFNAIIEAIYSLPIEDRLEIKNLLEHNIADSRRDEIVKHFQQSLEDLNKGKLKFSSNLEELRKHYD